jgi:ADP-ribose pyrophosphatase YjhB (NUDIX family)
MGDRGRVQGNGAASTGKDRSGLGRASHPGRAYRTGSATRSGRATALWLRVYRLVSWVLHPKYTIGSLVYLQRRTGEVLLVRQRLRTPSLWGLPGGFKRSLETVAEAAAREVREEVGLQIRVLPSDQVAQYEQPWAKHLDTLFVVHHDDRAVSTRRVSGEIAEVRWFAPSALPALTREALLALEHLPSLEDRQPPDQASFRPG